MVSEFNVVRFAFGATCFALVLVFVAGDLVLATSICHLMGFGQAAWGGIFMGLTGLNGIVIPKLANRLLKACGISRSSRMVEGRRPGVDQADAMPVSDTIEIRLSRSVSNTLMIPLLVMGALFFLTIEILLPRRGQISRGVMPLVYAILLGTLGLTYALRYLRILRVDDRGVTAGTGLLIWGPTIPWDRISSCDLVVVRDTFGKVSVAYPVLKDAEGKELLRGLGNNLGWASPEDQQRLLQIFKRRFPALEQDPWEL